MKWGANLVSISCVIAACAIVLTGNEGWGWFLFLAALTYKA